ncbi:tRNA (adenosine(37)-N6)-threonylcarbamoyltransferase complex ATPase subunit type 1 TsaE [Henriciella aquimarina]|uniref:tRNA (adenosine(37)-N6)-threonylcarbamoyltransferase complex ATPase subunit type 1 TsaE n=1 Tax=Henriciella aquimarina TaxID=545261 RepID=UPI000A048C53|nr:tRNA (adenosine(37)-N6)-threonylcarbamoyltransferase complex ATPase subunit type 1 TsaE [Henriciella aquimarina]
MSFLEIHLADEAATARLARRLAPHLKPGDVIALRGGLGAGKTTFARALISVLAGQETEVPSPTYTLVQTYDTPGLPVFHFDLYRLDHPDEVMELGWEETMDGLALIEWPDKAGAHLPQWRLDLTLEQTVDGRTARLEARGEDWQARLHGI